jgi:hypothetical protein
MNMPGSTTIPTPLDAAALNWFSNLKNQYQTLATSSIDSDVKKKAADAINEILKKPANDLVTQDMFDVEDLLLPLLSGPPLIARLKSLRDDYHEVLGDEKWKLVQPTLLPTIDPTKEDEIRAEARRLQEELHWQSSIAPWAAQMRESMMKQTLMVSGAFLLVFLILLAFLENIACIIVITGLIGGTVSSIQRIQSADLANSRALSLARYSPLKLGVLISPLLGAIFAVLLAFMLMSKTVTPGAFVPNVIMGQGTNGPIVVNADKTNPPPTPGSLPATVAKSTPFSFEFFTVQAVFDTSRDLALFIIWMFLAGFSERLVPDLLSKVAEQKKP